MTDNEIILFKHDKFGEIGIIFENGNPLFPATECAKILGYKNPNSAIIRHCPHCVKREVGVRTGVKSNGDAAHQTVQKTFISEGDLYRLIMRSKLPEAVEFESWVCDRILPSIRKHGAYFTAETLHKTMSDPRELAKLLNTLADEQDKRRKLEEENAFLSVKAKYYDRILQSKNSVPVTQIAKDYGMSAIAFNRMLHDFGIQYPIRGSWVLYAEYANCGYTQSKTYQVGEDKAVMHTSWTQRGRLFLYEFLKERGVLPMCEQEGFDDPVV